MGTAVSFSILKSSSPLRDLKEVKAPTDIFSHPLLQHQLEFPSLEEKIAVLSHPLRNFPWEEINREPDFGETYGDFYHPQSCLK